MAYTGKWKITFKGVFYREACSGFGQSPVLVITDRNDLDDQLFDAFASSTQLLRQEPKQVENRDDLRDKLKVASGGVVFTNSLKISTTRRKCF